jgi:hypothetical protein
LTKGQLYSALMILGALIIYWKKELFARDTAKGSGL